MSAPQDGRQAPSNPAGRRLGTPLSPSATRVMLLGSGELGKEVVIAPDRHFKGTNALLVDASVRKFAFGKNSLARHIAQGEARGVRTFPCVKPALAFDLDTAEDFSEWVRGGDALPDFLTAQSLPV